MDDEERKPKFSVGDLVQHKVSGEPRMVLCYCLGYDARWYWWNARTYFGGYYKIATGFGCTFVVSEDELELAN